MRHTISYLLFIIVFILSACSRLSPSAGEEIPPLTARMSDLQGTVHIRASGSDVLQEAGSQTLQENDQILTGGDGRVRLDLSTGTIIRLGSSTVLTLTGVSNQADGENATLKVDIGKIWIILQGGSLDVETPSGVASVRGSYLMVSVNPQGQVQLTCLEGDCRFKNEAGEFFLMEGNSAVIDNIQAQPAVEKMTNEQVEEWLNENPEAVVVVPSLVWFASPTPAETRTPTATATSAPTATSTTTATPLPTATVYIPPPTATPKPEEEEPEPVPTATPIPTGTASVAYAPNSGFSVSNVNINNGNPVVVGVPFTVSFDYMIWNSSSCPSCILQLVVVLNGQNQFCAYDGIPALSPPGTTGSVTESLTASTTGPLDIHAFHTAQYTCNDALNSSGTTSLIAIVNVTNP